MGQTNIKRDAHKARVALESGFANFHNRQTIDGDGYCYRLLVSGIFGDNNSGAVRGIGIFQERLGESGSMNVMQFADA